MKKLGLGLIIIIAVFLGIASFAGFTPAYLYHAPSVAAGIGAKLLCSARYVSGFSQQQAFADLVQYSPILQYLDVEYDEENKSVTSSFFRLQQATASYLPVLGCALDYPGHSQRQPLSVNEISVLSSLWPHGDRVNTPRASVQTLVQSTLERDNNEGLNTRALLVAHKGEVIAEYYAQGASASTPLLGWSMAKSLTSIMVGNLAMRGLLDADEAPGFSAWAQDERAEIRTADLLTMTDGLAFSEEYNPGDDATAMLFTEPSAAGYVLGKRAQHPPGTHFNYSSGTANILSRLHHDRTGAHLTSTYLDYRRNILQPMGFQHAVFETDASGVFVGSSYFYASARDWARLGQLMLNQGVLNGERVVSAEWVARSIAANDSANEKAYGYQWWLNRGDAQLRWPDLPEDAFAAQGNRQQWVMVVPSQELVIVRLGWTAGGYPANERFADILAAAVAE